MTRSRWWLLVLGLSLALPAVAADDEYRRIHKTFYPNGKIHTVQSTRDGILDGISREYYENGQLHTVLFYVGGRKNGPYKEYYESGQLMKEMVFKDDLLEGEAKTYYEDGTLQTVAHYHEDRRDGIFQSFYFNGNLHEEFHYKDGRLEGTGRTLFEDGTLRAELNYKADKLDGVSKMYYKDGQVKIEETYVEGRQEGPFKRYFENGHVEQEGAYHNGQLHGTVKMYYKSGALKAELEFQEGLLEGEGRYYYESGALRLRERYRHGTPIGPYQEYHENGALKKKAEYVKGRFEGEVKEFWPDETLKEDAVYRAGRPEGVVRRYDAEGNLHEEVPYTGGVPDGIYKEYYPNGRVKAEVTYAQGVREGPYRAFYKDGKVKEEGRFAFDELEGTLKAYHPSGNVEKLAHYKAGRLDGVVKIYYPRGALHLEENYSEGRPTGTLREYYESGRLKSEIRYEPGGSKGLRREYYESGGLRLKVPLQGGVEEGPVQEYYESGPLKAEAHYVKGRRQGPYKIFYETGEVKETGTFRDDLTDGLITTYYPDGQERSEIVYKQGKPDGAAEGFYEDGTPKYRYTFADGRKIAGIEFDRKGRPKGEDVWLVWQKQMEEPWFQIFIPVALGGVGLVWLILWHRREARRRIRVPRGPRTQGGEPASPSVAPVYNILHAESERMYRRLIETVESGIFMMSNRGKTLYVNHAFAKILGFGTKAEVLGLNLRQEVFGVSPEGERFLKALDEKKVLQEYRMTFHRKDGLETVLSVSANQIFDDRGRPVGAEGVVRDITETSRLEAMVRKEKEKLEALLDLGERVDTLRDREAVLQEVVEQTRRILECRRCSLMLAGTDGRLRVVAVRGIEFETVKDAVVRPGEPIAGVVYRDGDAVLVKNIEYDPRFRRPKGISYAGRSFVIAPLRVEDRVLGVICAADKASDPGSGEIPMDELDLKILRAIAAKAAAAIENVGLYQELSELTVTDPITRIYNYRRFAQSIDAEILRRKREKRPLCVMMMDIDDFKSYNDTYGHLEGDALLSRLGEILKSQLRQTDVVCRYAGDEFGVVFPDTDAEGARKAAAKVKEAVEAYPFLRRVTVSQGIAVYKDGMSRTDIIKLADQALYRAKHEGKNRFCCIE